MKTKMFLTLMMIVSAIIWVLILFPFNQQPIDYQKQCTTRCQELHLEQGYINKYHTYATDLIDCYCIKDGIPTKIYTINR